MKKLTIDERIVMVVKSAIEEQLKDIKSDVGVLLNKPELELTANEKYYLNDEINKILVNNFNLNQTI